MLLCSLLTFVDHFHKNKTVQGTKFACQCCAWQKYYSNVFSLKQVTFFCRCCCLFVVVFFFQVGQAMQLTDKHIYTLYIFGRGLLFTDNMY